MLLNRLEVLDDQLLLAVVERHDFVCIQTNNCIRPQGVVVVDRPTERLHQSEHGLGRVRRVRELDICPLALEDLDHDRAAVPV